MTGVVPAGDEIVLERGSNGAYVSNGTLLSPEHETPFPFNNAVLSWNAQAPQGTSLRFELRARTGGNWTPWYTMGTWDANGGASARGQSNAFGSVDVDTLKLAQIADGWQYRVGLASQHGESSPTLGRLGVVYANLQRPLTGPPVLAATAKDLLVPAFSQLEEDPAIANQICSPTSLAMVLNYYGLKIPVADVAKGVRDRASGIFGNWPLNTAFAASLGMDAHVDRFYSMGQVQAQIAQGRPVIMSIKFGPGELSNAPITSTSGHLIVARGFTAAGDVIVNDPIAARASEVRRVFKRTELEKVWLASGGIVYMVQPKG